MRRRCRMCTFNAKNVIALDWSGKDDANIYILSKHHIRYVPYGTEIYSIS